MPRPMRKRSKVVKIVRERGPRRPNKRKASDWEHFEDEVAAYIERELDRGNLGFLPKRAQMVRPAKYKARDTGETVTFELAIELMEPGNPNPTQVWIWECKHYPHRKVPVKDLRKFADELGQLSLPVKGTVVTPVGYQNGARKIADARGVAIWTFQKRKHFRVGLHGQVQSVEYEDIEVAAPNLQKPVSLATLIHRECFGKEPPPRQSGPREIIELG